MATDKFGLAQAARFSLNQVRKITHNHRSQVRRSLNYWFGHGTSTIPDTTAYCDATGWLSIPSTAAARTSPISVLIRGRTSGSRAVKAVPCILVRFARTPHKSKPACDMFACSRLNRVQSTGLGQYGNSVLFQHRRSISLLQSLMDSTLYWNSLLSKPVDRTGLRHERRRVCQGYSGDSMRPGRLQIGIRDSRAQQLPRRNRAVHHPPRGRRRLQHVAAPRGPRTA